MRNILLNFCRFILFLFLGFLLKAQIVPIPLYAAESKKVFASYMQGMPLYGTSIDDFRKDIQVAKSYGIDGFVYSVQSWNIGANPKIFTAADEENFLMILDIDLICKRENPPPADCSARIIDAIKTASQHPSYFKIQNRPVVVSYRADFQDKTFWVDKVLLPLKNQGIDVFFLPHLRIEKRDKPAQSWNWPDWFYDYAGGTYTFDASYLPELSIYYGEQRAQYMRQLNKLFMAGVTPYYFRTRHSAPVRDYIEYSGGEGIYNQWESIITKQKPSLVLLVTWNDLTESYTAPFDVKDPSTVPLWRYGTCSEHCQATLPLLQQHAGFTEYMRYFIQWYKTGVKPPIKKDALFYFYRTHPKNAVATEEQNDIQTHGDVQDALYITTMLTAPATLKISTGGVIRTKEVAAGIQHTRIPFLPGDQKFQLYRNNTLILEVTGDPILSTITRYNFIPTTGFAYAGETTFSADLTDEGDTPGDEVNIFDYNQLVSDFGKTGSPGWLRADIDKNGKVDIFDYNILVENFGK